MTSPSPDAAPRADAPRRALARRSMAILWLSIFVVGACGITYELLIGAIASYLLGNSVTQYSLTVGVFLAAMGIGAGASRLIKDRLLETFILAEVLLALIGGCSAAALMAAFTFTEQARLSMLLFLLLVGGLIGLEIPLLTRYAHPHGGLRKAIADVLSFDYLGSLVAAVLFPLVLLPEFGFLLTGFGVGLLNLAVATGTLYAFRGRLKHAVVPLSAAILVVGTVLGVGMFQAENVFDKLERQLYRHTLLFGEQTKYQRIVMTRNGADVRLFLDGHLQLSSLDEYRYHEALVLPAMAMAASRKNVLILGGGDGASAREVLRHSGVEKVTLVDLDPRMTALAKSHPLLTAINQGVFEDPRLEVKNADGFGFLERSQTLYDVVIVDFPDPRNEVLAKLYSRSFYTLVGQHLARGGVAVTQASSPFFAREAYWTIVQSVKEAGLKSLPAHVNVPSFGPWGMVFMAHHTLDVPTKLDVSARSLDVQSLPTLFIFTPDNGPIDPAPPASTLNRPTVLEAYERGWKHYF